MPAMAFTRTPNLAFDTALVNSMLEESRSNKYVSMNFFQNKYGSVRTEKKPRAGLLSIEIWPAVTTIPHPPDPQSRKIAIHAWTVLILVGEGRCRTSESFRSRHKSMEK
jgi:hypothetical protein